MTYRVVRLPLLTVTIAARRNPPGVAVTLWSGKHVETLRRLQNANGPH